MKLELAFSATKSIVQNLGKSQGQLSNSTLTADKAQLSRLSVPGFSHPNH